MDLEPSPILLTTVLADLSRYEATGSLLINAGDVERILVIEKGVLTHAFSKLQSETLGSLLVQWGRISSANVEVALMMVSEAGSRFGEALVDIGAISESGLAQALTDQIRARILNCFRLEEFKYQFVTDLPHQYMAMHFPVPPFLLEAVRETWASERLDKEMRRSENVKLRLTQPLPLDWIGLPPDAPEAQLLPLLEKETGIDQVIVSARLSERDTLSFLLVLWALRKLAVSRVLGSRASKPATTAELEPPPATRIVPISLVEGMSARTEGATIEVGMAIHKGLRLQAEGKIEEALEVLATARVKHKDSPGLATALARVVYDGAGAGRSEALADAAALFSRSAAMDPAQYEPWLYLARIAHRFKETGQARKLYKRALSIDPHADDARVELNQLGN